MRYKEILRMPTSIPTLKSSAISGNPGEIIDVPKFATRMAKETVNVTYLQY
jgi:hypothetical protein